MAFRTRTTSLSSVGVSTPIFLDPTAKTTVVQLSATLTASGDATIQVTLNDPSSPSTAAVTWTSISTTHYSSVNALGTDGTFLTILSPIGGLRISSTNMAGSSAAFTMNVLQSVTA